MTTALKIALLGYGKMGRLVEQQALQQGHYILAKISRTEQHPLPSDADICIDFSHPLRTLDHIRLAGANGKSIVIGTTGWEEHLTAAKDLAQQYQIGVLYSPNFSLGVALFTSLVQQAAALIPRHGYDAAALEMHHKHKADAPSGTAKLLTKTFAESAPEAPSLVFSSIRCGATPGTHTIILDSPCDTITLTHTARSREGFALGAIQAALWLQGKKGFYTFEDMMAAL